jgi:hypothetical protein
LNARCKTPVDTTAKNSSHLETSFEIGRFMKTGLGF